MPALFIAALAIARISSGQTALQPYDLPIGLSVSMPGKPEEDKEDKSASALDGRTFYATSSDAMYYVSQYPVDTDDQKLPPDQQLASFIYEDLAQEKEQHVTSYDDAVLDGWPGVEMVMNDVDQKSTTWSRDYILDGKIIEIGVMYDSSKQAPADANDFLTSLKQTGTPKMGPATRTDFSFNKLTLDDVPIKLEFPSDAKSDNVDLSHDGYKMTLHRFTYDRDIRTFDFEYLDLPDGADDQLSSDDIQELRQRTLEAVVKNVQGVSTFSTTEQRDGRDWLTGKFNIDKIGFGRVDVLYFKGRIFTFMTIGPESWQDSDQVKRFFDSIEVEDSAGG